MRNLLQIQGPGMKTSRVPDSGFCSHRVITYMQQNPCHKVTMDNVPTSQTGAHAMSLQLCPTLCDPMDRSLPGSSVHGILQARILEWVAMPFSRGTSQGASERRGILWRWRGPLGLRWVWGNGVSLDHFLKIIIIYYSIDNAALSKS